MKSNTGSHGDNDLDLHSAINSDGKYDTNTTGRIDASDGGAGTLDNPSLVSSHESKPSSELINNTPEQTQRSITPIDLRKPSSGFWEIDVSGSSKYVGSTPSLSSVPRQDEDLNQKPAHPEDHDESDRIEVGKSKMSHCHSRNESGSGERESQIYTASNSSMTSPALESSTVKNNHPSENSPSKIDEDSKFSTDDDIPGNSKPQNEQSIDGERHYSSASSGLSGELAGHPGRPTQNPSTQVMKHPADSASSSSYRIPSHVFDKQTTSPVEWSATSNESLFSIHTGNTSFSRDMYLLGKNDEFDKFCERNMPNTQTNMSGPLTDVSSNQSSSDQISKSICVTPDESRTAAAQAEETMREVIGENTEHLQQGIPQVVTGMKPSRLSDANNQSFAFQILTDVHVNSSANSNGDKQNKEVQTQPQTEESPNEVQEPKSAKAGSSSASRWFSCFCCCCSMCS